MSKSEEMILDDILRYGDILSDKEFESEGTFIRQYIIQYKGETYHLTKQDGRWIYIYHEINH